MYAHLCQCGLKWWVFRHESLATYKGQIQCDCGGEIISWIGKELYTTKLAEKPQEESPRFEDRYPNNTFRRERREQRSPVQGKRLWSRLEVIRPND
jgi:hypothetical protein